MARVTSYFHLLIRLLRGIILASFTAAIGSLLGFLIVQRVIFPDYTSIFGLQSYLRYELPFYPLATFPLLLLIWRLAPPNLISYVLPAVSLGVIGAIFSIDVRLWLGDEALAALIAEMGTPDGRPSLLIIVMFMISALPIGLFAGLAAWSTLHVWVQVPSPSMVRAARQMKGAQ